MGIAREIIVVPGNNEVRHFGNFVHGGNSLFWIHCIVKVLPVPKEIMSGDGVAGCDHGKPVAIEAQTMMRRCVAWSRKNFNRFKKLPHYRLNVMRQFP